MARYIDVDKLKQAFSTDTQHLSTFDADLYDLIVLDIDEAPTADVAEVKHGEWKSSVMSTGAPHCSLCNGVAPSRYTYCPHCGAKMDGERRDT